MSEQVSASERVTPSEERVWDALTYVHDPELEVDVVNLGLVYPRRCY